MKALLTLSGSVVIGSAFGWLGSLAGVMTGYMLGTIGSGVGMYAGAKLAQRLGA